MLGLLNIVSVAAVNCVYILHAHKNDDRKIFFLL
jgi:hypothetical protein